MNGSKQLWMQHGLALALLSVVMAALYLSYIARNDTLFVAVVTAIVTNFNVVVGYYFGSSEGSRRKTEALADTAKQQSDPVAIAVSNPPQSSSQTVISSGQ